jgi:anti-sigma factor RsiW
MRCQDCCELLSAYIDGELPLPQSMELEQHIITCAGCRERFEATRALKHVLARVLAREEPPAAVVARIDGAQLAFRRAGRRLRLALAAVVAVLGVGVSILFYVVQQRSGLTRVLVADHYRSLPNVTPAHLTSGDPVAVARYFEGRTSFPPFVPSLRDATLVGARLCNINGRKAELLFYDVSGSTVSLFVCPIDAVAISPGCRTRDGAVVCSGTRGRLSVHAVGSLSRPQLQRLVADATSIMR